MNATFHIWTLSWGDDKKWHEEGIPVPNESSAIRISGSGSMAIGKWSSYWDSSSQGGTSRAVFSAFCDGVISGTDPYSGGAPQLVGLFRIGEAQTIGVVIGQIPYLFGLPTPQKQSDLSNLQWRNCLFERVKANGELLQAAKKHHAPKGLAMSMEKK